MKLHSKILLKSLLLIVLFILIGDITKGQDFNLHKNQIVAQLEKTYDLDQSTRNAYNSCVAKYGTVTQCLAQRSDLVKQDSINQVVVASILDRYGWLPVGTISEKANQAFFYVIQHGSLEFQKKYADSVKNAFTRKEILPIEYMFFVDRLNTKQGKGQIYGTQSETDNLGNQFLYPIQNWNDVNVLRAHMGIDSIALSETPEYFVYPKILKRDSAVLIGHIYKKGNIPVVNAVVMKGDEIIGRSNDKGYYRQYKKEGR